MLDDDAAGDSMSKPARLLRQFSDDIVELARNVVQSTAVVTGQTRKI